MTQHPELLRELASRPNGRSAIKRLVEESKLRRLVDRHFAPNESTPSSGAVVGVGIATAAVADSLFSTLQESTFPLSPTESAITTTVLAVVAGGAAATAFAANKIHNHTYGEKLRQLHADKESEARAALVQAGIHENVLRDGAFDFYRQAVESDPSLAKSLMAEPKRSIETTHVLSA